MDVSLVMFKADGSRREFPIDKERVLIGRTNHCDLRVPLSSVSRKHCEVRVGDGKVLLRDLGSSNGTFHNSNRVTEVALAPGDEIVIGPVVFTVVINGQPRSIDPVKTMLPSRRTNGGGQGSSLGLADPHDATLTGEQAEHDHASTADLEDPISALDALAKAENEGSGPDAPTARRNAP